MQSGKETSSLNDLKIDIYSGSVSNFKYYLNYTEFNGF